MEIEKNSATPLCVELLPNVYLWSQTLPGFEQHSGASRIWHKAVTVARWDTWPAVLCTGSTEFKCLAPVYCCCLLVYILQVRAEGLGMSVGVGAGVG